MSATVRVTRQGVGIELRRGSFDILVDDGKVGAVEWHETVEVPVAPGRHTLAVRAGRYSGRTLPFDIGDGETASFRCHGAMMWPRYVASILEPGLAISLTRE